jgi:hypothetical protein
MSKNARAFLFGAVSSLIFVSLITAAYAAISQGSTGVFAGTELFLSGERLELKDSYGNAAEAFLIAGTTYAPVKSFSEALGKSAAWDSEEKTVYIDEPLPSDERLGVSKIIFKEFYGLYKTTWTNTIDFTSCQYSHHTDSPEGPYDESCYVPSEKHSAFFESVSENGFLRWNDPDWKWYGGGTVVLEDGRIADLLPAEDGFSYEISVFFDDGTHWERYCYETFPENWNQMRKVFIELTGKDVLRYEGLKG